MHELGEFSVFIQTKKSEAKYEIRKRWVLGELELGLCSLGTSRSLRKGVFLYVPLVSPPSLSHDKMGDDTGIFMDARKLRFPGLKRNQPSWKELEIRTDTAVW